MALTDKLTAIADAIRGKTGGTEGMTLDTMVSAIEGIESGGIPGVTVIKGEYIHSQNYGSSWIKIIHNLGEIKPFVFHFRSRGSHFENTDSNRIYEGIVVVSFVNEQNPTYGADATVAKIVPRTQCCFYLFDGGIASGGGAEVKFYDSETNDQRNYGANMWADGFTVGMYRSLALNVVFDYVLYYGDLFGGDV